MGKRKTFLLALALLAVVGLLIIFLYWLFRIIRPAPTPTATPTAPLDARLPLAATGTQQIITTANPASLSPNAAANPATTKTASAVSRENKIQDLSTDSLLTPTANPAGGLNYYNYDDNKFYRLTAAGPAAPLSDQQFYNVQTVIWSADMNQAVLSYPDNSKIIYNFATNKQVTLPKHWQEFQFSPDGQRLVFKSLGTTVDDYWLGTVNSDGSGGVPLEKIGVNAGKVITAWSPNNQVVAMMPEVVSADQSKIYFIGLNGENFPELLVNGSGFEPLWSPNGQQLLYSVYDQSSGYKPTLWITTASGDQIGAGNRPLEINTWADKCVFATEDYLYCAVPRDLADGVGILGSVASQASEDVYLINLKNGQQQIIDSQNNFTARDLQYSAKDQALYFIDRQSGLLKKLSLPAL